MRPLTNPERVPSAAAKATAAADPGAYVYEIDPWFDPDGDVPGFGVVGAWRSGEDGLITGDFQANPNYRPSPAARGFRRPLSELERAMQAEVTGYGQPGAFEKAVAESDVWIIEVPGHEGEFSVVPSSAGRVVEAFTSPDLVGNGPTGPQQAAQIELARVLAALPPDVRVVVNPGAAPTMVIPEPQQR